MLGIRTKSLVSLPFLAEMLRKFLPQCNVHPLARSRFLPFCLPSNDMRLSRLIAFISAYRILLKFKNDF